MSRDNAIIILLLAMFIGVGSGFASTLDETVAEYKYVIKLATSSKPISVYEFSEPDLNKYKLYIIKQRADEKIIYHLKLGFFKTQEEAKAILKTVQREYLNPVIETSSTNELALAKQWLLSQQPALLKKVSQEQVALPFEGLMKLASQAMQDKNYPKAIGIYTRIINAAPNKYQQDALENLAVARERNNQLAHAVAEYRRYLKVYPTGEGAVRVKRQLDNLLAQQMSTSLKAMSRKVKSPDTQWVNYGNLYQFFLKDTLDIDDTGSVTTSSLITTNLNYTGRTINGARPMEAKVAVTHVHDTENSDDDKERLTSLYFDMTSMESVFDLRIGRQKNKTTNVFNRYDGIDLGYLMSPGYKARYTYGYPVEFTETVDDRTDKYFYALGLEMRPNSKVWNTSIFYLEQQADNILDRQELAIDTRYLNRNTNFYSSLDYSIQYETVNFFLMSFNQHYADKSTLNVIADYRKTPFLTTTNALQGQVGVSSLTDLLSTLTEEEIEQLSLDRTATYQSLSAYYSKYLYTDLQLTADFTVSDMSGTVASGGVEALQDTGTEYSYAIGLIKQHLFMYNDRNLITLRFSELATADIKLLNLSSLLQPGHQWRINPKLRYDLRDYIDGRSSTAITPALSIKHKLNKYWQFELELTYEDKETDIPNSSAISETSKELYAGYILSF